ncbi:MAG: phosphatase PAP2 family protein [Candidatus Heimdallarchaeota archaeon]|nr:phosphatase PAP2 family protein [Candidatus Heimdallarchaeota archaeon]
MLDQPQAKHRLKFILIGQVSFWALFAVITLLFGENEMATAINPGYAMDTSAWQYTMIKLYSDTFYVVVISMLLIPIITLSMERFKPYRRIALQTFYTFIFAGIFVEFLKPIADRPRPFQEGSEVKDQINNFGETTDEGSMPSGHVAYSGSALAPTAAWVVKKVFSVLLLAYGAFMMYVRMFIGVHFAYDVLVGNIITIVAMTLSFLLFTKIYRNGELTSKQEWMIWGAGLVIMLITQLTLRAL